MRGDVVARIVRSDGQEFALGVGDWLIPKDGLENWANLPYEVASVEIPSYDGAVVTGKRVSSVDRSISAIAANPKKNAELRARAIRFFNPKFAYEVHLTYQGRTRWCEGEQIGFRCSEGNIYEPVELDWSILCANPYLLSESDFGKDIAEVSPRLGFPFMSFLPPTGEGHNKGFVAGKRQFSQTVEITNDGDVPSGMRFRIVAKGDVVNPQVRIGDGYVRAIKTMREGDSLELDLSSRPPRVLFNGQNGMNLIDRKSSILSMYIDPGETTIEYDADDGEQYMSVSVFYNKQYLGI